MNKWWAIFMCFFAGVVFAAQDTNTFVARNTGGITYKFRDAQLMRCDDTVSIDGSIACSAGDWSEVVDCRGMTTMTAMFHVYAGTATAKIWNCANSVDFANAGVEDPAGSPSTADPDPLCVDLTAGAGVTLEGSTTTLFAQDGVAYSFLVGEIHACTNCDSTLSVACAQ